MKKVVILGNGFDINLGLETSYYSFVSSEYWPFPGNAINPSASLKCSLQHYCGDYKWMDIEQVIENYATYREGWDEFATEHKNADEGTFKQLCESLTAYLLNKQKKAIDTSSMAYKVIKASIDGSCSIYSFNYTAPDGLSLQPGQINYIHGSLADGIILGVREAAVLLPKYDFLRKTFSLFYPSTDLVFSLQESSEVVFFGHSLSPNDYHYFDSFFTQRCSDDITRNDVKRITFITKNHDTEMEIKKQLWHMNNRRTDRLFTHNLVSFIHTDNPSNIDVANLNELVKRLTYIPKNIIVTGRKNK